MFALSVSRYEFSVQKQFNSLRIRSYNTDQLDSIVSLSNLFISFTY